MTDVNLIVAAAFIVAGIGGVVYLVFMFAWRGLCRINERHDRAVIARGRDCNLSAGNPTASHPIPADVLSGVPREPVGTSGKPALAGTSIPKRPDGTEHMSEYNLRQWARDKTREAILLNYQQQYGPALERLQEAEHALRCLVLESKADNEGVVR